MMRYLIRKFTGWLANFYPNTVFYARDFMPDLDLRDLALDPKSKAATVLIGVAVAASRTMEPGSKYTATFTGVTDAGKEVGHYRITIDRLTSEPDA